MYLNEPVHQDSSSGICEMPGQVSIRKRVPCLGSLQGLKTNKKNKKKQEAQNKWLNRNIVIVWVFA